jgi:flagellar export protein FliJ
VSSFRFRGQRVLDWRRVQEDAARKEFLRASATARAALERAQAADADRERTILEYRARMASALDVDTIERYRNWIRRQQAHAEALHRAHAELEDAANAAGQALRLAQRHVKVMERLRDRAAARHQEAERLADLKALDELATLQYVRRRMEGAMERGN